MKIILHLSTLLMFIIILSCSNQQHEKNKNEIVKKLFPLIRDQIIS